MDYTVDGVAWIVIPCDDEDTCVACQATIPAETDSAFCLDGGEAMCMDCFDSMVDETADGKSFALYPVASVDLTDSAKPDASGSLVCEPAKVANLGHTDPMGGSMDLGREYSEREAGGAIRSFTEADGAYMLDGRIGWILPGDTCSPRCPLCHDEDCWYNCD